MVTAGVVGMADYLVRDCLLMRQELLEADNSGNDECYFTDKQGFAGNERNGAQEDRNQCGCLKLEGQQKGQ
jgi:hypothetical protein